MKNFAKLLLAAAVITFGACNNNTGNQPTEDNKALTTRGGKKFQAAERFSAAELGLKLETMEAIKMVKQQAAANADAQAVMSLFGNLNTAQNAQALDIKFSMSDAPVEDGVFVFAIESEENKKLTLEMFDEEGFEMAAQNQFNVTTGKNYKALNVKEMDNGGYVFRLKDAEGKELVRQVNINN